MEIAIFGAGIAGLMSAITLRAQGHRCRIYERMRQGHETGMGFILMPDGIECLQSFGVKLDWRKQRRSAATLFLPQLQRPDTL